MSTKGLIFHSAIEAGAISQRGAHFALKGLRKSCGDFLTRLKIVRPSEFIEHAVAFKTEMRTHVFFNFPSFFSHISPSRWLGYHNLDCTFLQTKRIKNAY